MLEWGGMSPEVQGLRRHLDPPASLVAPADQSKMGHVGKMEVCQCASVMHHVQHAKWADQLPGRTIWHDLLLLLSPCCNAPWRHLRLHIIQQNHDHWSREGPCSGDARRAASATAGLSPVTSGLSLGGLTNFGIVAALLRPPSGKPTKPSQGENPCWPRRRASYNGCAVSATQAIAGAPAWWLELLGWEPPPEHQETRLNATRAGSDFRAVAGACARGALITPPRKLY